MAEGYQIFSMVWQERTIEVSHQANWLRSDCWHIELRCDEKLSLTQTGYRSIFVPEAAFNDDAEIEAFVAAQLDEAADSDAWRKYVEDSRQLTLF